MSKMTDNKLSWKDISYRTFHLIQDAAAIEDETEKMIAITQAVYGDDVIELPVSEFTHLFNNLVFLTEPIPNDVHVKEISVNGRTYYFSGMLGDISAAQYMDFLNYLKNKEEAKQFSVFFIPKGHKYNDGYDMLEVFEDIQDMPITILTSASFFFVRQLETFIKIFQRYSMKRIKNLKLPKETTKTMLEMLDLLTNLEFSHLY